MAMNRKRMSEDVLVRALDFCDERGFRFGQFIFNVVRDAITLANFTGPTDHQCACALFNVENEELEKWIREFIEKANRRRETADKLIAQAENGEQEMDYVTL